MKKKNKLDRTKTKDTFSTRSRIEVSKANLVVWPLPLYNVSGQTTRFDHSHCTMCKFVLKGSLIRWRLGQSNGHTTRNVTCVDVLPKLCRWNSTGNRNKDSLRNAALNSCERVWNSWRSTLKTFQTTRSFIKQIHLQSYRKFWFYSFWTIGYPLSNYFSKIEQLVNCLCLLVVFKGIIYMR